MKYKVGQKVKILSTGHHKKNGRGCDKHKTGEGQVGKIEEIGSLYPGEVYKVSYECCGSSDDDYDWYREVDLELTSDTPKRAFQEGDWVKMLTTCGDQEEGKIYQLKMYKGSLVVNSHKRENGEVNYCSCNDNWQLVDNPERKEESKGESLILDSSGKIYRNVMVSQDMPSQRMYIFKPGYSLWEWEWDSPRRHMSMTPPKPKKFMATLKTIASKLLDADIKALVKAGWLDEELELTEDGEQAVLSFILLQNKVELAKEARNKIKDEKDEE